MSERNYSIVGLGEALIDLLPDGEQIGGAPMNVAFHAQQLGSQGVVVSRLGQDERGRRITSELRHAGIDTSHLQSDPDHATGTVLVDLDIHDNPIYTIVQDVAWDYLYYDFDLVDLAQTCSAICFGTLAQRTGQTRNTMYQMLDAARSSIKLFDVNLRQEFFNRDILDRSLKRATAVKLNTDELNVLRTLFNLPDEPNDAMFALMKKYDLPWACLTRGVMGNALYVGDEMLEDDDSVGAAEEGGDAVGAGDSVAAALLHGAVRRWSWKKTLQLANRMGQHVASQQGACPALTDELKQLAAGAT